MTLSNSVVKQLVQDGQITLTHNLPVDETYGPAGILLHIDVMYVPFDSAHYKGVREVNPTASTDYQMAVPGDATLILVPMGTDQVWKPRQTPHDILQHDPFTGARMATAVRVQAREHIQLKPGLIAEFVIAPTFDDAYLTLQSSPILPGITSAPSALLRNDGASHIALQRGFVFAELLFRRLEGSVDWTQQYHARKLRQVASNDDDPPDFIGRARKP